jgi:hypothetical protein
MFIYITYVIIFLLRAYEGAEIFLILWKGTSRNKEALLKTYFTWRGQSDRNQY